MDPGGLLLFAILFIWQLPHSYAIALYRRREYEQAGLVVLPSVVGDEATRRHVLGYSVLLLLVSAGLLPVGVSGLLSEVVALGLGGGGLWMAWQGLANLEDTGWPRRMFLYTLAHMSGLFLVLVLDLWV
jgi:protoheme IX farnesyltransferase